MIVAKTAKKQADYYKEHRHVNKWCLRNIEAEIMEAVAKGQMHVTHYMLYTEPLPDKTKHVEDLEEVCDYLKQYGYEVSYSYNAKSVVPETIISISWEDA